MELTPRMTLHARRARAAAAGSIVLLKNIQNTLPLLPGEDGSPLRAAVFGAGQLSTPLCVPGMTPWRREGVLDALCACERLRPDGLLAHRYRAWALEHPDGEEYPPEGLPMAELRAENDAAIVVLARGADDARLSLTQAERRLLSMVSSAFSRTVLILAVPAYLELPEEALGFGAIVYLGLSGQEGPRALADILTGVRVPLGQLAHSWPKSLADYDAACQAADSFAGYRYFDSFGLETQWCFGHGLGYGTLELISAAAGLDGCDVTVSAELENVSERFPAGQALQVYVSHPETDASQPVYRLQAFGRTQVLSPGQRQTLELRFPITDLAVFHPQASAYVLDEGVYIVRLGFSARTSLPVGAIRVTRSAVVQAAAPLALSGGKQRQRPAAERFLFAGEEQTLQELRRRAIRFSDRYLPRTARRKGDRFSGCRAGSGESCTLEDVRQGRCNLFELVAAMDDESIRTLLSGFSCPANVPGARGASAALPRFAIGSLTLAGGCQGAELQSRIQDDAGKTIRRQDTTAFPAPALLACSFDPELIEAVSAAVGTELREYGVDVWQGPSLRLLRTPRDAACVQSWSEEPLVCAACAQAMNRGLGRTASALLHFGTLPAQVPLSIAGLYELYVPMLARCAPGFRACCLPAAELCAQPLTPDAPLVRAACVASGYTGMLYGGCERTLSRLELERAALRLLQALCR